jgi:signal transduction histidine kinase
MVSHDLRSPLNAMTLGVELISGTHGHLPHLSTLEHAAQRMKKLVEGLLDASQAETTGLVLDRERTTVGPLFESTVDLFATRAERARVHLAVARFPSDSIFLDRERVLQILSNLVSNALSFTPKGGQVSLAAVRLGLGFMFSVTDTCPCIPDDEQASIFQSFHQAQQGSEQRTSRRGSVGLGLYISRSLVLAHGGRIGVESKIGEGSTFWFEIPCEPDVPQV